MAKKELDFNKAEREMAEAYAHKARIEAFDTLVDMALDGVITMEEAEQAWVKHDPAREATSDSD